MSENDSPWMLGAAINGGLLYGAVLLALGSLLLLAWMRWPASVRAPLVRQGRVAGCVAIAAFVLALGLGGAAATGEGLLDPGAWTIAARSSLGESAAFGVAGGLLGVWAIGRRSALAQQAAAAFLVGGLVVTGHAATAAPVPLMAASVGAHLIAAGFWGAALWPLAAATRALPATESGALLDAFAARMAGLLILLVVSGVVLLLVQIGAIRHLYTTAYGVRLLAKLAGVAVMIGLGARNNLRLTPALKRGDPRAAAPFRHAALAELALAVLVTALAAALATVEPPRGERAGAPVADRAPHAIRAADAPSATAPRTNLRVDAGSSSRRPGLPASAR